MKLYESPSPNARRVQVFMAEKGIDMERVPVDIRAGENLSAEYLAKNPGGRVPVLELDDGTFIAESVAICRYLEGIQPEPPLFGTSPLQSAQIEMWQRRVELLYMNEVAGAFQHLESRAGRKVGTQGLGRGAPTHVSRRAVSEVRGFHT